MSKPAQPAWRPTIEALQAHGPAVALASDSQQTSYAQLNGRAEAISHALTDGGIQAGDRVALLSAGRGHDEAAGLLGILLSGAVVVPLNHDAPAARLATLLVTAGCRAIVHDEPSAARVRDIELPDPPLRVEMDDEGFVLASIGVAADTDIEADPSIACVLHTSGSSGAPKAVPMRWQGIDAFTHWMTTLTKLGEQDRVLRVAELSFDLAWFDHLATFRAGATLLTMSRRKLATGRSIAEQIRTLQPSVIYGVPSLFIKLCAAWPKTETLPSSLRTICFAGEVFPPSELERLAERAPQARLFNLFGPTETNVCTFHEVDRSKLDGRSELPIGVATPYAECRLVDTHDGSALIEGAGIGELVVRGPTALGGECRTRDRVERAADGLFYFRGRLDRMIKIRGYRVDPSEVEAALCEHALVRQAAVLARQHPRLGTQLSAYVAAESDIDGRTLRAHLATQLPSYMVPQQLEVLPQLPVTANGKIDYAALSA
jgi:acyl-CoA synthetase (AMP-forming)/AMP-acid ligase II